MKGIIFCKRTITEILREPISYIFCLGFPIIMLILMTIVNESIPAQANMTIFQLKNLAPGIAYFGLTFVMLFACIQVSKDRATALLMRLHASPMKSIDFIMGYTLSVFVIGVLQLVITSVAAVVLSMITKTTLPLGGMLLSIVFLLPSVLMFISFGMIFGTLVNEKAAPGICSIIISVVGLIGGIWMDVDGLKGAILQVAKALPFYYGVKVARLAMEGSFAELLVPLGIVCVWTAVLYVIAIVIMNVKLKKDTQ